MKWRRPERRSDCTGPDAIRPCPWVSCRHHLGGDALDHRSGVRWGANTRADEGLLDDYSCSLDVVDEHPEGMGRKSVAWLLGISSDRVMQIELLALRRLYAGDLSTGDLRSARAILAQLQGVKAAGGDDE